MSDRFYDVVVAIGRSAFWLCTKPLVLGAERTARPGPFILAANHESPYDVGLVLRHSIRHVDFLSIVEMFRKPFVGWLYRNMNVMALDRSRPDAATVRAILDKLAKGRAVAMFPEGGIKRGDQRVVVSGRMKPGVGRLAKMSGAPIIPCVMIDSRAFWKFTAWLPHRRTRYGIIFGPPVEAKGEAEEIEAELIKRFMSLHAELSAAMAARGWIALAK